MEGSTNDGECVNDETHVIAQSCEFDAFVFANDWDLANPNEIVILNEGDVVDRAHLEAGATTLTVLRAENGCREKIGMILGESVELPVR